MLCRYSLLSIPFTWKYFSFMIRGHRLLYHSSAPAVNLKGTKFNQKWKGLVKSYWLSMLPYTTAAKLWLKKKKKDRLAPSHLTILVFWGEWIPLFLLLPIPSKAKLESKAELKCTGKFLLRNSILPHRSIWSIWRYPPQDKALHHHWAVSEGEEWVEECCPY